MFARLTKLVSRQFGLHLEKTATNHSQLFPNRPIEEISEKSNLPTTVTYIQSERVHVSEIEARIYKVASNFPIIKMDHFSLDKNFKELNLDSLESIAFVCAIEEEFRCVFEETVFDNFSKGRDVLNHLSKNNYFF